MTGLRFDKKKKINNKQIKRTYLDNEAVRWRQMSKRFQVSAPLFDFGQLLRLSFHWNSLWWKWWFTSIQTAGSFSVEVLRWSVWLGASPWWIFWLQWYKNILEFFLFAAPFRQGVTRTCEPSCEGPGTQVYEVFLRRFMSILASFVQEANVQLASC